MTTSFGRWRRLRAGIVAAVLFAALGLGSRSLLGALLANLGYVHLARPATEPGTLAAEKALATFGRAIRIAPSNESAWLGRAEVLLKQGNNEAAIDSLIEAEAVGGNRRQLTSWKLGNAWDTVGQPDRALAAWQAAGAASYFTNVGQALLARGGDYCAQAEDSLQRAVLIDPTLGEARYALARDLECLGKVDQAAESYCQAAPLYTDYSAWRYLAQGHCFRYEGKWDEAIGEYQKVLSQPGKSAVASNEARFFISRALYDGKGDLAGAVRYVEAIISQAPNEIGWYIEIGDMYLHQKQYPEAVAWYERAKRVNPSSPEPGRGIMRAYVAEAYGLRDAGKLEAAENAFRRIVEQFPSSAEARNNLGWFLYLIQRDAERALAEFTMAMSLAPDDSTAYTYAGYVYLNQGRLADASSILGLAIARNPRDAEAHATLGMVRLQQADADASIMELEKAVSLNPQAGRYHEALGDALAAAGQLSEAVDSFRRALELEPNRAHSQQELGRLLDSTTR